MTKCEILMAARRIAILGASPNPSRTSHDISAYLRRAGYDVIPVNPNYDEIQGSRCFASLALLELPVDIVDVFRAAEHEEAVRDEILAMKHKPRAVWFQLFAGGEGVRTDLVKAGITVFVDQCIKVDHAACQ
jgi:hypothetical protein